MELKMLQLAVVDDDDVTRKTIRSYLKDAFKENGLDVHITGFQNAETYFASWKERNDSLIFLDIERPGRDGINLAGKLREGKCHSSVVFVSNREERVFDSLSTHPFGFVRKSHFKSDIGAVIKNFLERVAEKKDDVLLINRGKNQVALYLKDITFIETVKRKVVIHQSGKEDIACLASFKSIEEGLQGKGFVLTYKGVLVNFEYRDAILNDSILLKDKTSVPLSRRNAPEVKEKFLRYRQDRLIKIY